MNDRFLTSSPARPPSRQRRLRQCAGALARHGLGWLVLDLGLGRFVPFHRGIFRHTAREDPYTKPEHLRLALEDLGVSAIKLGLRPAHHRRDDADPAGGVCEVAAGDEGWLKEI